MNEQRFGLPEHTENPEDQHQAAEQHTAQEAPGGTPEPKEQEESFESRYKNLALEWNVLKLDGTLTFEIAEMQIEGLQTLLSEYGSDAVFEAIEHQPRRKIFSTFEVVRALENDPKKRAVLFEKMKADAKRQGEEFDQWIAHPEQSATQYNYFRSMWGSAQNFCGAAESRADTMKALDGVSGRIAPRRHYDLLGEYMAAFGTYLSQEKEGQALKEQLAEAGDNIFRLVENRDKITEKRRAQLQVQANRLHEELAKKIEEIKNELNAKFEEWRATVVSDLSKVQSLEITSDAMQTALQKALEMVKEEIANHRERTEQDIADRTASLRNLMDGVKVFFYV